MNTTTRPPTTSSAPFESAEPWDEHNQRLVAHTHPPEWTNPTPPEDERYNLVVIGGGTAGLVTAVGAAGLGAKVALIEKKMLGGDCLTTGCVPSKALLRSAHAASAIRRAPALGVKAGGEPGGNVEVDFPAVMARLRARRADISPHDSAKRLAGEGVDVYLGEARFTGKDTLEVAGQTLRFSKACIATGSRAVMPPIDGIQDTGVLTHETLFSLTELPKVLVVIGAGPIGCEMAQGFARLGSRVVVLETSDRILAHDDPEAAELVRQAMVDDGVEFRFRTKVRAMRAEGDRKIVESEGDDPLECDQILVGVGRAPNVQDLGLEAAGVKSDDHQGIAVDQRLRTANPRIFAAGDVCSKHKFTHAADAMARIVIGNALFMGRSKVDDLVIPWCTYTDPPLAHVGKHPEEVGPQGPQTDTLCIDFTEVDRAIVDEQTAGFLKVHRRKGKGDIVGATIVGQDAGNLVTILTLAITSGAGLGGLASMIAPYPTRGEIVKKAGDAYSRTRLTPLVKKLMGVWLGWAR